MIIFLNFEFRSLLLKRTRPHENYKPCEAECYPNNPEHTIENQYLADTRRDKTEDKKCGKSYNSKATITGGLTHLSCHHGIVKGFTALQRGESPLLIVGPALRRLPPRHPLLQENYTGVETTRLWNNFFLSFLAKTKREPPLPGQVYCEIWPHSLQFWL